MSEWFFGRRMYANPALRWAANPLLLLSWLLAAVDTFGEVRSPWLPPLYSVLLLVSLTASGVNWLILRKRGRASYRDPFGRI